ncbi:MAG: hypothetical protein Q9165_005440 [Trypethelium subeluteriae]
MAAVYKSLTRLQADDDDDQVNGEKKERKNRQKLLVLSSRGVTHRHRHLINDLYSLLPHSRKDAKLDTKTKLYQLNELADLFSCNNVLFFEARKGKDLYAWISKPPNGPTVKMHVQNLHTMEELHFPGNCLKGSRSILNFDSRLSTTETPHLPLIRELLTHVFGVPKTSRKVKPFVDHIMCFTYLEGRIWVRNYQISETEPRNDKAGQTQGQVNGAVNGEQGENEDGDAKTSKKARKGDTHIQLVEIGPRFVLTPIVVLESSFGGPVIYENKEFVSPNQIRSELRKARSGRFNRRAEGELDRKVKKGDLGLVTEGGRKPERDALDERDLFA